MSEKVWTVTDSPFAFPTREDAVKYAHAYGFDDEELEAMAEGGEGIVELTITGSFEDSFRTIHRARGIVTSRPSYDRITDAVRKSWAAKVHGPFPRLEFKSPRAYSFKLVQQGFDFLVDGTDPEEVKRIALFHAARRAKELNAEERAKSG